MKKTRGRNQTRVEDIVEGEQPKVGVDLQEEEVAGVDLHIDQEWIEEIRSMRNLMHGARTKTMIIGTKNKMENTMTRKEENTGQKITGVDQISNIDHMRTPTMTLMENIMREKRKQSTIIGGQEEITALTIKKTDKEEEEKEPLVQKTEEEGDITASIDEDTAKGP